MVKRNARNNASNRIECLELTPKAPKTVKRRSVARLRSIGLGILATFIASGCGEEKCEKHISEVAAFDLARGYFLSRPLEKLDMGSKNDKQLAATIRRAGFTDETYRELLIFAKSPEGYGNQKCGRPRMTYEVREDKEWAGYTVVLSKVYEGQDRKGLEKSYLAVFVSYCGTVTLDIMSTPRLIDSAEAIMLGLIECPGIGTQQ